jgi:chromosome segregation ATPase
MPSQCRAFTSKFGAPTFAALVLAVSIILPGAGAATESASSTLETPLSSFKSQVKSVKDSLEALNAKIESSAKSIEALKKPEAARKEVEALEELVSQSLSYVADNGQISTLAAEALGYCRGKLEQTQSNTKFSDDDRRALKEVWSRHVSEMEKAVRELQTARQELAGQLRSIQNRADFAQELLEAENASEMIKVIQMLAGDMRGVSQVVKKYLQALSSPNA